MCPDDKQECSKQGGKTNNVPFSAHQLGGGL